MKEDHLFQCEAAAEDQLVDVALPGGLGRIAEFAIEGEIAPAPRQARRGPELRLGPRLRPLAEKQVVDLVRRDEMAHWAERFDLAGERIGQLDRRAQPEPAVGEPHQRHPRRVGKAEERNARPLGDPDVAIDLGQHRFRYPAVLPMLPRGRRDATPG